MLAQAAKSKPPKWKPKPPPRVVYVDLVGDTAIIKGLPRSTMNSRTHWRVKHRESKPFRAAGAWAARLLKIAGACRVVMTRFSAGELDDDNLAAALKAVRDGIADHAGVNDRDKRWTWVREQGKCGPGEGRVEVRVEQEVPRGS